MEATTLPARPSWRGVLHSWTFVAAIPAGILLVVFSERTAARTAAAIYAVTLLLVFGTSAAYHRLAHSERARTVMQRLDHSMIYLLITGTYVPVCIVALPRAWGISLLAVVGVLAVVGIVLKLAAFRRAQWISYALYPIMGWVLVFATPVLADNLSTMQIALIVAGGLAYTLGLPVLLTRRPDPWPKTFGYHEVWHVFTVLAAGLHFVAVSSMLA